MSDEKNFDGTSGSDNDSDPDYDPEASNASSDHCDTSDYSYSEGDASESSDVNMGIGREYLWGADNGRFVGCAMVFSTNSMDLMNRERGLVLSEDLQSRLGLSAFVGALVSPQSGPHILFVTDDENSISDVVNMTRIIAAYMGVQARPQPRQTN